MITTFENNNGEKKRPFNEEMGKDGQEKKRFYNNTNGGGYNRNYNGHWKNGYQGAPKVYNNGERREWKPRHYQNYGTELKKDEQISVSVDLGSSSPKNEQVILNPSLSPVQSGNILYSLYRF